jgi:signal peptidase II
MKLQLEAQTLTKVLIIVAMVFLVDQFTKWLAFVYLQPQISVNILGDFFRLTYVENPGMAFGINLNNRVLFNTLSIGAAVILVAYLFFVHPTRKYFTYSLALILGGAFGNLFDRLMHGKVIDFMDFDFIDIHIPAFNFLFIHFPGYSMDRWPVFNVADMAVSTGMIIIIVMAFFFDQGEERKEAIANVVAQETTDN